MKYPQKRPLMLLTSRPVQLETPMELINQFGFTPNDAFFVRWHLAGVPTRIDVNAFRINVHGLVEKPLELSLADLATFDSVDINAVCECSGNSRGFFSPRVPGGQWGNGAVGHAKWTGVRLADVLKRAGVQAGAVQVRFNGAETPVLPTTPDFMKSLDVDHAMDPNVIIAYRMNDELLPVLNGFPVRLIVPGWYATYWVKMLDDIEVLDHTDDNFWMKTAYRIPDNDCGCVEPGTTGFKTVPINKLTVRSFITNIQDGAKVPGGQPVTIIGVAFDSGSGIARVQYSTDGGQTRNDALLGDDIGNFAFRQWTASFVPESGSSYTLVSYAISNAGEEQRIAPRWNPSGYMLNTPIAVNVTAT
ncbi:MAG TPA: molybdopterin-dependent oxidoreductase [Candidatus Acidoferrales bacterium]|nr:molybdopterin-dependent oxidoreductase [Candidatus Acidoferrales bacterium]